MKNFLDGLSRRFYSTLSLSLLWVTFTLCRIRPIYWEDVWWHLGVGQYILNHHRIPKIDVMSWTFHGAPWINAEWLYELVLYGWVHWLGLTGVIALKIVLLLLALYFMDRRLRHWKASVFERLLFLSLAFMGGWPFWVERADLSSLALLSALFCAIDAGDFGRHWWRTIGAPWVFIFALWPNIHGAFPLGLLAIGLWGCVCLFRRPASGRRVLSWTVLCAAATLLNPYGIQLWQGIFKNMGGHLEQVAEWLPPQGLGFSFFFFSLGLSVISVLMDRKWTLEKTYGGVILVLFAGYALRHQRFVHFYMICAFPYAARQWLQDPIRWRLAESFRKWEAPVLAACSLILFTTAIASALRIRGGIDAADSGYVKGACDFIEAEKIPGPFYNEYKFGSYWIWRFQGNPPVYQDGRSASILGYDRFIDETLQAQRNPKSWNLWAARLGIQAALVRYPPASGGIGPAVFDRFFPRDVWGLVYWDDLSLIFVRRTNRYASLLRQWECRAIKPDWTLETYLYQVRSGRLDRGAARKEIDRALALNPDCWRARVDLHWLDQIDPQTGTSGG